MAIGPDDFVKKEEIHNVSDLEHNLDIEVACRTPFYDSPVTIIYKLNDEEKKVPVSDIRMLLPKYKHRGFISAEHSPMRDEITLVFKPNKYSQ